MFYESNRFLLYCLSGRDSFLFLSLCLSFASGLHRYFARERSGKIHSDFERGFIRAEIVSYDDLIAAGSYNAAKEKGLVRIEG